MIVIEVCFGETRILKEDRLGVDKSDGYRSINEISLHRNLDPVSSKPLFSSDSSGCYVCA